MEIKELISVLRPGNGIIAAIGVFTGYAVAQNGFAFSHEIALGLLSAFFITGAGNAINDYFDFEIDKKLGKNNAKNLRGKTLFIYSMFLFAIGMIFATNINIEATAIALVVSILLIIYSGLMQQYKFLGNVVVSLGTALTLIFGAAIVKDYSTVIWLVGSAFFATLAREMIKDAEDMKGDMGRKKTLPMLIGIPKTKKAVFASYFIAVLIALVAFAMGITTGILYLVFLAIASGLFYNSWKLFGNGKYNESQKFSKYGMMAALLAFLGAVI